MKTLKRILSMMLVVCMIFTSQAFVTFAEGMENTEAIENETTIEETTVEADDDLVGVKLGEPEEETETQETLAEEPEEETTVGASTASPEEETTVGAKLGEPEGADITLQSSTPDDNIEETDYPEEPEEEATVEAKLGELEKIEANTEDKLFGDQGPLDYIEISQYTIKTYHVGDTYDPSDLKIKAYYTDADTEDEAMVEVAYTDDASRFSFNPDCVNNPFTESTTEEDPYELDIYYYDGNGGEAFATIAFQVHPASTPTTYTVTYNQNLPEGYNLSEGKTWYADETFPNAESIYTELEGWYDMTCEDTDSNTRVLQKWNTKADGTGIDYNFGDEIADATHFTEYKLILYAVWSKVYTLSYNQNLPEGYNLSEGKIWYADETFPNAESIYTELNGSEDMTCEDATGTTRKLLKWNTKADGTGTDYNFVQEIADESLFTNHEFILYAVWSKVYTLSYNQNLPEGYNLSEGKIWYADETFPNAESIYTELNGSEDMTCEDATGTTRKLLKWNTKADGTGTDYNFVQEIADATHFTEYKLILYAVWEPVAPGPTAFAYWKIDGDDANKTIHYYASAGEGRTAVTIDIGGIEYTGLDDSEREKIKKAVIEEPIVATDVRRLFYFFKGLVSITDLGKLDTTSATSFESMFDNCSAIEELDVSGLETNSLTDTSYMFPQCSSLTKLTFGNYFDTSKVRSMPRMFVSCTEITELDLTSFNTSSVTDMNYMFFGCSNLKKIYVSDYFTVEKVDISDDMFTDCLLLEGGSGTLYSNVSEPYDKRYAHIDGGSTNPGLFSGASTPPTPPTPGPTPPGPTPPSPGGGETGGSSSGSSDPTHGPMGDLTKNPLYADTLNGTNNIPESKMVSNDTLATTLKSYPENANSPMVNARDDSGNVGYGQWLRVPNTTTWYFLSGSFNQGTGTTNTGFLANGWFNLGWDGQDKWYYFDSAGVMKIGWHQEGNKIYYLQADFSDNWYGKAMTGQQMIDGQIYNFDSNGVLIQ